MNTSVKIGISLIYDFIIAYKQPLSSKISEWSLGDFAQTVDKAYILVYYLNKIYS